MSLSSITTIPPPPVPPRPLPSAESFVPVVDLRSDPLHTVHQTISNAAVTTGLVFIRNLPLQLDFRSIQRIFDTFYQSPEFSQRVNSGLPEGGPGIFKLGGKWTGDDAVENKASIGFPGKLLRTH